MIGVIELQIISKVINTGDYSLIEDNLLTEDYFVGYEEEFRFIEGHYKQYKVVPDKSTFLAKFPNIELVEVKEPNTYLVDTIREQALFNRSVPIMYKIRDLLQEDANAACEYMIGACKELTPSYALGGTDIIADGDIRLELYKERVANPGGWYYTSGFPELDDAIQGFRKGEELVVLFARPNEGKTWIAEKIITHIWSTGANVGFISPEMGAINVGYRFDTLFSHFSNKDLTWAKTGINVEEYAKHIEDLKQNKHKFVVATPYDFNNDITVSKLRNFVKQKKLDVLAIDGITYLRDERTRRTDNESKYLTNISEDLMNLSVELQIPIFVVTQANRAGVVDGENGGTPKLENIRGSDGISHNATIVLALRHDGDAIEIGVPKNRFGERGADLKYLWNVNVGEFIYTQNVKDVTPEEKTELRQRKQQSVKDIF